MRTSELCNENEQVSTRSVSVAKVSSTEQAMRKTYSVMSAVCDDFVNIFEVDRVVRKQSHAAAT